MPAEIIQISSLISFSDTGETLSRMFQIKSLSQAIGEGRKVELKYSSFFTLTFVMRGEEKETLYIEDLLYIILRYVKI